MSFEGHATTTIVDCVSGDCLQRALLRDGAVAVHIPGLDEARKSALVAIATCESGVMSRITLPDGSTRRSIGAKTLHGIATPLTGVGDAGSACKGIDEATAALRALVDAAAHRLLAALQPIKDVKVDRRSLK